jgi:hypothetical protein
MPNNAIQLSTSHASGGSDAYPPLSTDQVSAIISRIGDNSRSLVIDGTSGIGGEYTGVGIQYHHPWWSEWYCPRPYPYYTPIVIDNTAALQQEISALRKQIESLEASVKKNQRSAKETPDEQKLLLLSGVLDLLDTATTDEQRSKILELARRTLAK